MMEFVRTAIKSNTCSHRKKLAVIAFIFIVLGSAVFILMSWYSEDEAPVGQLRAAAQFSIEGANGLKAVTADNDGKLYIADSRNNRIVVTNAKGREIQIIDNKNLKGKDKIVNPVAVAVAEDKLWVSCAGTKRILVLDLDGELIDVLPHRQEQQGMQDVSALALTVDQAGNLYAADGEKQRIMVFDQKGKLSLAFGSPGCAENKFMHINGLAVDENQQRLIIQDSGNLRLVFTTLDGKFLSQTTIQEKGRSIFIAPRGLAYSQSTGLIYLADAVLDTVFALNEQGKILAKSKELMSYPQALVLADNGFLYVANREAGSMIKLNP